MCASSSTTHSCGLRAQDRVDIHLLEHDTAVLDRAARNDLEIARAAPRCRPGRTSRRSPTTTSTPVAHAPVRVPQHRVGLADSRRGTDVDPQPRPIRALHAREHLFCRSAAVRPPRHASYGRALRTADALNGLFIGLLSAAVTGTPPLRWSHRCGSTVARSSSRTRSCSSRSRRRTSPAASASGEVAHDDRTSSSGCSSRWGCWSTWSWRCCGPERF